MLYKARSMTVTTMALLFGGSFIASLLACGGVRRLLLRYRVLDRPVARSVHREPVPRGAGLAIVPILTLLWYFLPAIDPAAEPLPLVLVMGVLMVAVTSWLDDLRGLPALPRLGVQAMAVLLGLVALAQLPPVFQGWLPQPLDLALAGLLWLWFVNLFNFMDGSDAVAGGQALTIGLGLAAIAIDQGWAGLTAAQGLALAGVALGFLVWNRPPAKIFLGDVGSIPLGYLIGWLLLWAATQGAWAAALILPAWFLADTTMTLARRAWRRAPLLEAHAEHSNSAAIRLGHSHARVAGLALIANIALALLALGAERNQQLLGLAGAAATVWLLMRKLKHPPKAPVVEAE
jgi:UDP-N-acetylmuramyl pentapeptide phosphotransferase/UDP-N-acetylglucosamine-1-phosphate transferase